jgi:hypothetical protein
MRIPVDGACEPFTSSGAMTGSKPGRRQQPPCDSGAAFAYPCPASITSIAGNHVEHIYAKLGVSSRAAATLVATQHGLMGTFESASC